MWPTAFPNDLREALGQADKSLYLRNVDPTIVEQVEERLRDRVDAADGGETLRHRLPGHQPLRLHRPSARVAEKTAGYRADDGGRVGPSPSAAGDFTQGGGR
jgi:hypothetical protein